MTNVQRTNEEQILRNHEGRIANLERSPGPPSIRFNTDNEGGSLYVNTNEIFDGLPPGGSYGMYLVDSSGGGIFLGVLNTDGTIDIGSGGTDYPRVSLDNAGLSLVTADADGQVIGVYLTHTGTSFQVLNHVGAVIFEIDEDGTITGGSLGPGTTVDGGSA
jgi:hypothetical protein